MPRTTRKLLPNEAEAYAALRQVMLAQEPFAFLASPEDDFASNPAKVREHLGEEEAALFGAFVGPELVGAVGVLRARRVKARHTIRAWGMFVLPAHRGAGAGRTLLGEAIDYARRLPGAVRLGLSVSETAEPALRLYQSMGFEIWGTEPDAISHGERRVAEHHLSFLLVRV